MLKSNMMKNEDFDSKSTSSMTTQIVSPNGNETTISETKSSTTEDRTQPEEEVEVTKIEPIKTEDPNKIYGNSNEPRHDNLNADLNSEQTQVERKANNSANLEKLIGDYSYNEDFDMDPLDELDPGQDTISSEPEDTDDNLDHFLTGLY